MLEYTKNFKEQKMTQPIQTEVEYFFAEVGKIFGRTIDAKELERILDTEEFNTLTEEQSDQFAALMAAAVTTPEIMFSDAFK